MEAFEVRVLFSLALTLHVAHDRLITSPLEQCFSTTATTLCTRRSLTSCVLPFPSLPSFLLV